MSKILGIDLGTTNSAAAVMSGGEPVVIPSAEGERLVPSVVAVNKNHERLVGRVARNQAITNPQNTVFSIKRFMGRKYDEVQNEIHLVPYEVVKASLERSYECLGINCEHVGGLINSRGDGYLLGAEACHGLLPISSNDSETETENDNNSKASRQKEPE